MTQPTQPQKRPDQSEQTLEADAQMTHDADASTYDIAYATPYDAKNDPFSDDEEGFIADTPAELRDKYRFITKLGEGTQGKVFLAKRRADGQKVAIKQLQIDSIKNWKEYTLFHREADMLSTLDMTGVAKFYEACEFLEADPPCSYIVQEYIEGPTIKELLATGTRIPLTRVYDLTLQLIDILEKLHKHDPPVIHRDIKPSNIILKPLDGDNFQAYLIDFGAVANPQVQSGGSTIAGTFGYMSPEQHIGQPTPQSDTYALAALIAYLISGVNPADMKIQDLRLVIDPYVENHPPALVQTLRRMLEPSLQNRLADYDELRKRFLDFQNGRYVVEQEKRQNLTKRQLKKRLSEVKHLCQAQNLEVWEALPDMPENRPPFPMTIRTRSRLTNKLLIIKTLLVFLVCVIIVSVSLVAYAIPHLAGVPDLLGAPYLLGASLPLCFISILFLMSKFRLISKTERKKDWRPHVIHFENNGLNVSGLGEYVTHPDIYRFGRKTIATISDIYYVPYEVDNTKQLRENIYQSPIFRIYYKFNPPDDESPNDLIHTVETHVMPDGKFKVGDPLPILYAGQMGPDGILRNISSMPFPFPAGDMENKEDYICTNITRMYKQ